jgi:hypothetical protein
MKHVYFFTVLTLTSLMACANVNDVDNALLNKKSDSIFFTKTKLALDPFIDLDGDGKADHIEIVNIKSLRELPPNIELVTPWSLEKDNISLTKGSKNNLYVELGNGKNFLIHDTNEVSVLDTNTADEIHVMGKAFVNELELGINIQGSALVIPTEAGIDTYLYWDKNTFIIHEPLELP